MQRSKFVVSLYLLLIRDNKILLLRRANTGYEDGKYGLPSGHLEEHETLRQGIAREAREEIGVHIKPQDLHIVHTLHRKEHDERVDFFFVASDVEGEAINCEPEKCDHLEWFPLNNLPENTIGYIKRVIDSYLNNEKYAEIGWK